MSMWSFVKDKDKTTLLLGSLFGIVLLLKFLESFYLMSHGDALSYHLVLPKLILERGFFQAHDDFYLGHMAGFFDYLYLIPQWLFESKIIAQMLSQFMHTSASLFLAIFVFYKVFYQKSPKVFYLSSLCLLTFSRSPDFFIYAKNDGALASLFLITTLLVFKRIGTSQTLLKRHILIGIGLGLLPAIKMSGLIYATTLGLFYLYEERKDLKHCAIGAIISLSIASVIMIRNWYFVGNPLFPAFMTLFPTKATPEMISFMESMLKMPFDPWSIPKNYFVAISPKAIGLLAIPAFIYNRRKKRSELNKLLLLILLFTSLYCVINSGYPADRFYFGCHFILIFYLAQSLLHFLKETKIKNTSIVVILVLLIFSDSKIDKLFKRDFAFYKDVAQIGFDKRLKHKYIPHTKIWEYVEDNSNILSDRMPMQFYAPKGALLHQAGHAQKANFIRSCSEISSEEFNYFRFLIINKEIDECGFFGKLPKTLLYEDSKYELYKLLKLGDG